MLKRYRIAGIVGPTKDEKATRLDVDFRYDKLCRSYYIAIRPMRPGGSYMLHAEEFINVLFVKRASESAENKAKQMALSFLELNIADVARNMGYAIGDEL
jgi:methionine synthase I (cobalamin-dependent)